MLSRIAESLFWIGRYVERAEDTARILDVQTQMMVEDPTVDIDAACRTLLSVMGAEIPEGREVSLERETFPSLIGAGFYGEPGTFAFMDIGTPESYAASSEFFQRARSR